MQHQPKYEVEDDLDVDFFAALKGMQQQQQQQQSQTMASPKEQIYENTCLITNEPLNVFHVSLQCGHKFNYEPLYQEVLRQKGRLGIYNYHEKIGMHQIKCPYCRTLTNHLLPCIGQHPVIKRLNGVNAPAHMCMPGIACHHNNCEVNAFYEHDSNPYCLRHYNAALKAKSKASNPKTKPMTTPKSVTCAAEIQTGKNKGQQCSLNAMQCDLVPPLCKKHSKCNVILYQMH